MNHHDFKNFDLKVDVMTFPKANSGIYFHTKYQEAGWPKFGIECQVDNSHGDWRRTGSLWGIRNISVGPGNAARRTTRKTSPFCRSRRSRTTSGTPKRSIYQDGLVTVKLDGKTDVRVPGSRCGRRAQAVRPA